MIKKLKNDNKGFTLVELIVVLVILAILAAILVPGLLGYIDEAKTKQDEINAKAFMTALQSELTKEYAKGSKSIFYQEFASANDVYFSGNSAPAATTTEGIKYKDFKDSILSKTGAEEPYLLIMYTRKYNNNGNGNSATNNDIKTSSDKRDLFTVYTIVYWSDKAAKPIFYNFVENSWNVGGPYVGSNKIISRDNGSKNQIVKGNKTGQKVRAYVVFDSTGKADITALNTYIQDNS